MEAGADAAVSDVLLPGTIGVAAAALAIAASLAVAMLLGARWRRREPLVPPRPAEPVVWNGADVAWVVAVAIFLQMLATSLGPRPLPVYHQLVLGMLATLGAAAAAAWHLRRRGASWRALGFSLLGPAADLRLAVGTVLLLVAPLLSLAALLDKLVPYRHPIVEFLTVHHDAASLAVVALAAVVVAPLVEEFFFRRILQGWLERRLGELAGSTRGPELAIAGSALAFGLAHLGQGLAWLPLVVFGAVLGYLARQTGSIVPGILAHALFNAISLALVLAQVPQAT
jgi:membrane protease YdiL (CAAX protease family)